MGAPPEKPASVSVVIPARDCQSELDRCLTALAYQSHSQTHLEVVIVDDRSEPALTLPPVRPENTILLRTDGEGYGSGRARDVGARQAQGDVMLFLDADIVADRFHVEAHTRWHEVTRDAVVLGFRDFVDIEGITIGEIAHAVQAGDLRALVAGRPLKPHAWIELVLESTAELTTDREDLWRPIVGASVSTSRDLYAEAGGFAHFPRRGIVDIEFGYRCFTAGAVVIPDRAAYSLHQGERAAARRGPELTRMRAPLIANYIASERYRPPLAGRRWAVPYLHVIVPAHTASFKDIRATVDDILANRFDDLIVSLVVDPANPEIDLCTDYWSADSRVTLPTDTPRSGFPSPVTALVPIRTRFQEYSLAALVKELRTWTNGLLNVAVAGLEMPVEVWATRALHRSYRSLTKNGNLRKNARELFGEKWLAGSDFGIGVAKGVTDSDFRNRLFYPIGQ